MKPRDRMLPLFLLGLLAFQGRGAASAQEAPRTILFVGNSFTFGANSPVRAYRPDLVSDLNGDGIGGVPALFETFAREKGLNWRVSLETSPGKPLGWHLANRRSLIDRRWDVVVLQGYSTLDPDRPGDPAAHVAAARALAALLRARNPAAEVDLVSTWGRPDLVYRSDSPWSGQSIERMASDLAAANRAAIAGDADLNVAIAVGAAFDRAIADGIADPNPYDGIAFGQVDLWSWDHYHASAAGYYLEALMVFGRVTGIDPPSLGRQEAAAAALGLEPALAAALQRVAANELAADRSGAVRSTAQRADRHSVPRDAEADAAASGP